MILLLWHQKELGNSLQQVEKPLVEWDNDKPTIVALREIEEGLLDNETLEEWLKDDILSDGFSAEPISQEGENIG